MLELSALDCQPDKTILGSRFAIVVPRIKHLRPQHSVPSAAGGGYAAARRSKSA